MAGGLRSRVHVHWQSFVTVQGYTAHNNGSGGEETVQREARTQIMEG